MTAGRPMPAARRAASTARVGPRAAAEVAARVAAGIAALVVVSGLAACAPADRDDGASAAATPAPPALTVDFRQYRSDAAGRMVALSVANSGREAVRVTQVRLDSPSFTPVAPTRADDRIGPGERVDFRVPLGAVRCDASAAAGSPSGSGSAAGTDGGAVVVARAEGGREVGQRLAFGQGRVEFARLVTGECDAQRVAAVADLSWGPRWTAGGRAQSLRGVLQVRRRPAPDGTGGDALAVTQIGGSVLLTMWPLAGDARPLATLAPGRPSVDVPVEVTIGRCDGHALADSKKTFLVPVQVSVGGGEPVPVVVTATGAARTALQGHITAVCSGG